MLLEIKFSSETRHDAALDKRGKILQTNPSRLEPGPEKIGNHEKHETLDYTPKESDVPNPAYGTTHQMPMAELRQSQPLHRTSLGPRLEIWSLSPNPSFRNLGRRPGKIASGESGHQLNFAPSST